MAIKKIFVKVLVAICVTGVLSTTVFSDEGLWDFNAVPREKIEKRYGVKLSDAWLQRLQRATVRLDNGGTGAFISPNGLVVTNQHVAQDYVQKLSSVKNNYVKDGYMAREQSAELKLPEIELRVLERQEDVTQRVNAAAGRSPGEAKNAQRGESVRIVEERDKTTGLTSDVVSNFNGLKHTLHSYKVYTDVRLVFMPEREIANFGGDNDNYTFPRYWMDVAVLRVYENDKPVRTDSYLPLSQQGAKAGETIFVAGYPIATERYLTAAHVEYLNRVELPLIIKRLQSQRASALAFGELGEEQSMKIQTQLFETENTLKALEGRLQGLARKGVLERRREVENGWRREISRQPNTRERYERAFAAIEKARRDLAVYEAERRFLDETWGFDTGLFRAAREHVRLAQERAKSPAERLPGFDESFLDRLEKYIASGAPKKDKYEELKLASSLALMKDVLGESHPAVKLALAGKSPAERATEIMSQTRLDDLEFRKSLIQEGLRGLESSTDPMIVLARWVDAQALVLRQRYRKEVVDVEGENYPVVEEALQSVMGEERYPDANFTLRLSIGQVKEYTENNKKIIPFTNLSGIYDRAEQNKSQPPYRLPEQWVKERKTLKLETPFNFITDADVSGGNSGSPVVNQKGELVGIIFDSNQHALVGKYIYDSERGRAIALDVRGLLVALKQVYRADALLAELARG